MPPLAMLRESYRNAEAIRLVKVSQIMENVAVSCFCRQCSINYFSSAQEVYAQTGNAFRTVAGTYAFYASAMDDDRYTVADQLLFRRTGLKLLIPCSRIAHSR